MWRVAVVLGACSFTPLPAGPDGPAGGEGVVESNRRLVTFEHTGPDDLVEFPVLVSIAATQIDHAQVTDPATQLRFSDPDTSTDLPFEIEHWDPGGESLVWVRVPVIERTMDSIELVFGADAGGMANPAALWDGYELVHHLGAKLADSTANARDGTAVGAVPIDGQIGPARSFTGGAQRITLAGTNSLFNNWAAFTLELWLRLDYPEIGDVVDDAGVIDKGGPMALGRVFTPTGNRIEFQTDFHFIDQVTGNNDAFQNTEITLGTWAYIVYAYDGQRLQMYEDGVLVHDDPHPSQLIGGNSVIAVGSQGSNAARFSIDEVRISQTRRDASWIAAQHRAMTRQLALITTPASP
jgi:hypothetical protein